MRQGKSRAIRNPLILFNLQANIGTGITPISAISAISPFSPFSVRVRTVRLRTARLLLEHAGDWDPEMWWFLGIIVKADQDLAEFESRFVNIERSNPGLESRARNPELSRRARGSGNPASGLG